MTTVKAISDDLRERMIDEGARMLAEHGADGLSLRKLAAAAGTSTMAVYTRFGDKQRLLAAMYREGFRRLGEHQRTAARRADGTTADAGDDGSDLLAAGRAYRQAALASPHLYGLMFGPPPPGLELSADDLRASDATYAPLVADVRAAVAAGRLAGDPARIALHLWVVVHGMVSLELSGRTGLTGAAADRAYDEALDFAVAPFRP